MEVPGAKTCFPEEDRKELLERVDEILKTGWLTLGKYGKEFEKRFAEYVGAKYAVAVNSGTSALEIILRALSKALSAGRRNILTGMAMTKKMECF